MFRESEGEEEEEEESEESLNWDRRYFAALNSDLEFVGFWMGFKWIRR
jgi:hypothetical protein